jgi:hypothetical protein
MYRQSTGQALWASKAVAGTTPREMVMQPDGNLVAYNTTGAYWASGPHSFAGAAPPFRAVMLDTGNFVLMDSTNRVAWSALPMGAPEQQQLQDKPSGA